MICPPCREAGSEPDALTAAELHWQCESENCPCQHKVGNDAVVPLVNTSIN